MSDSPRLDLPAGNMPNPQGMGRPSPRGERGITGSPQESGLVIVINCVGSIILPKRELALIVTLPTFFLFDELKVFLNFVLFFQRPL